MMMENNSFLMPTYGEPPVQFVSGKGARLKDENGKEYLDFIAGISVINIGHSNKEISACIKKQSKKLLHTSNLFGNEHNSELAKEIGELLTGESSPDNLGQVFFCNSGAEANEAAIKLARKFGGHQKYGIVCASRSFHGRTLAALSATGQPEKQEPFAPMLEGFKFVEYGNSEALASAIDQNTAAVLLEPILGESGIIVPPDGYLKEVREICSQRGALMMLDEVQTGMGRTGTWFAFQAEDVLPDIVTLAKALGNGFPIGACWAKKEIAELFEAGDHGSTFGGQALAASVARCVIKILKEMNAPKRAEELGAELVKQLSSVQDIKEVRGKGLMLAVELYDESSEKVVGECLEQGLVVTKISPSAIRITPPLIIEKPDIAEAVEILAAAIKTHSNTHSNIREDK